MSEKAVRLILQFFLRDGAWAPVLVLVMHRAVYWLGIRQQCDWLMHYSGGVAITFFFWRLLLQYGERFGSLNVIGRRVFAFALGCTMAVFWELAEFASDKLWGTRIQHHIHETMMDLVNGVCGACTTVALIILFARRR